jgi:hypothetical protein
MHPEFGLLCPSPRRRRALRLTILSIATTLAIGATMGLAVARWPGGEETATPAQPASEPAPAPAPVQTPEPARVHETCKADTGSLSSFFLDSTCGKHVRHGGRSAGRVATVIIGHTDVAPEPTQTVPPTAAATGPSKPGAASAEKSETATAATAEQTTPIKKPKPKAIVPNADAPNAFASTATRSYDSFGSPFHSIFPQSGSSPFGQWPRWR